jgi:hypothetical protein
MSVFLATCSQDTSLGPAGPIRGQLDLSALLTAGGQVPIPIDQVFVELRRVSDGTVAFSRVLDAGQFGQQGDSLILSISLVLDQTPQQFSLFVEARGGGVVYYTVTGSVTAEAYKSISTAPLPPVYVGPGAGADSVTLALSQPLVAAGDSTLAVAVVWQGNAPVANAPVGILSSDTTKVRVHNVGFGQAYLVGRPLVDDSVDVTAVTPSAPSRNAGPLKLVVVPAGPPLPRHVTATSPTSQTGVASAAVGAPPAVLVTDQFGSPLSGASVVFAVTAGGGTIIGPATVLTGLNGVAAVGGWTLGAVAGLNTMSAAVTGLTPVVFTANSSSLVSSWDAAADFSATSNPNGDWRSGWSPTPTGAFTLYPSFSQTTMASWFDPAIVNLGTPAFAKNTGAGTVLGVAPGQVTLHPGCNASEYSVLRWTSPATQSYLVNAQFLTGDIGNTDATVLIGGASVFTAPSTTTNPAFSRFQSVPAGTLVDFAVGTGGDGCTSDNTPVVVTIRATSNVTVTANSPANQSGTVATAVGAAPSVLVRDAANTPLPGVAVTFAVASGGGSLAGAATVVTDPAGIATAGVWTLGTAAGANTVTATVSGVTPAVFTATGTAGTATVLVLVSGDGQTGQAGVALLQPLIVEARDQFANPVSGLTVNFAPTTAGFGSATPSSPVTGLNGQAQTSWTLGNGGATQTLSATSGSLTPVLFTATNISVPPAVQLAFAGVPGVGVGLTAVVNVTLTQPAPVGGVAVSLSSANQSVFTVAPTTLNVPQGQTAAGTVTLTGVSVGTANLDATAPNYAAASLSVDVQNRNISVPVTLNVPYGQTGSLPIQLPAPAPTGGVTFTVQTSAPGIVDVLTPTVTIAAGGQTANATLKGTLPGPAVVTVSNPAFVTATSNVTSTAVLNIVQGSATLNASFGTQIDIDFTSNGAGIAAPAPGVAITSVMTSTDSTCIGAVTPVTIPTGLVSVPLTITYGGTATLPCTAKFKVTAPNIQPDSINVTVQPVPPITLSAQTVGSGLQTTASGNVGATNHGGVLVHLVSGDPNLFLAPDLNTAGGSSADVFVPNGQSFFNYVVQGKEGVTGTNPVTVTATAPGFATGTGNISLVQGALDLINVPSTTTTFSAYSFIYARVGLPNSQTTPQFLVALQEIRAGAPALPVTFALTDPQGAATLVKSGLVTGDTLTANVPVPRGVQTPTDTTQGGVALQPQASGNVTVSASIAGFLQVTTSAGSAVTITQPQITLNAQTVGSGLQTTASGNVGATNHGGTTVRITSSDPNLLLAPDLNTVGSSAVSINIPNGQSFFNYVVQAKEGLTGTTPVTVTATAGGFSTGTGTISLVQGALDLQNVPSSTTTLSAYSFIYARVGLANSQTTPQFLVALQEIRAGAPALPVTFALTDPQNVATLVQSGGVTGDTLFASVPVPRGVQTPTDTTTGGVAIQPQAAGAMTVSASIAGFLQVTSSAGSAVTITQPQISLNAQTVGSGLQTTAFGNVGATNHGGVSVHLVSNDPNLLLAPDVNTVGQGTLDVTVPNGQSGFNYVVQAKEGLTGTTPATVTATATGFATGTGAISLVQGAMDLIGLPTGTTTLSPYSFIYARVGIANSQSNPSFLIALQEIRAGAPPITVSFSSTTAAVADMIKSGGVAGATLTAQVPAPRGVQTPTDTTQGGVAFRPLLAGTTVVSASATGFLQVPSAAGQTVTIIQPGISLNAGTVASGLMTSVFGSLGAANHGGVTVTLSSSNPALLLAPDFATPGASQIFLQIPNGQTSISYVIQGLEGLPDTVTAGITATASGFTNGTTTVDVVLPYFDVIGVTASQAAGGPDNAFYVRAGITNGTGAFLVALQSVRIGAPGPLSVTVQSGTPTAGTLVTSLGTVPSAVLQIPVGQAQTPTSVASGGVALRPLSAGTTVITTTIPGFFPITGAGAITVTIQ